MRVKVYEIRPPWKKETERILHGPGGGEYVLDTSRMQCIITVKEGKGSFKFVNWSREKLIRETFDAPSFRFVAGGKCLVGVIGMARRPIPLGALRPSSRS